MTINVDPELGEILGLLDYKIQRSTFTEEGLVEELGWEVGFFRRIFEDEKDVPLERLLQVLGLLEVHPADFFNGGLSPRSNPAGQLRRRTPVGAHPSSQRKPRGVQRPSQPPPVRQPPVADSRLADVALFSELTSKAIDATKDLAAVALWLVGRAKTADRRMLFGLFERVGSFGAAVEAIPRILAIVDSPEGVVWAIEHQRRLLKERWRRVEDVADDANIDGIHFLTDLEIRSARGDHLGKLVKLRERLAAVLKGEGRGTESDS